VSSSAAGKGCSGARPVVHAQHVRRRRGGRGCGTPRRASPGRRSRSRRRAGRPSAGRGSPRRRVVAHAQRGRRARDVEVAHRPTGVFGPRRARLAAEARARLVRRRARRGRRAAPPPQREDELHVRVERLPVRRRPAARPRAAAAARRQAASARARPAAARGPRGVRGDRRGSDATRLREGIPRRPARPRSPMVTYSAGSSRATRRRKRQVKSGQSAELRPVRSRYQLAHPPEVHTVPSIRRSISATNASCASARGSSARAPALQVPQRAEQVLDLRLDHVDDGGVAEPRVRPHQDEEVGEAGDRRPQVRASGSPSTPRRASAPVAAADVRRERRVRRREAGAEDDRVHLPLRAVGGDDRVLAHLGDPSVTTSTFGCVSAGR
jgi:hypothetical protein